MFLFTNAIHLLPYTGAGSGMLRALSEDVNVSFTNNDRTNEFVITINRQISNQPNADSDTIRPKITNKQRDIVNFCSVPRSSKEILERVGVTYHSKNIQTYIMSLIEAGYLEMTNPEHPNASNQKYRRSKK